MNPEVIHIPPAADLKWVEVQVAAMRERNPEVMFVVLAEDCAARVVPGDLLASIRVTLGDEDARWNDATGDGPASPEYLNDLAAGVLATVVEHYTKEDAA